MESFIEYCRKLIRNARRSHLSKGEVAKALETVFGDVLHNPDFQEFLARTIGLSDREQLSDFLEYADESEQRGRKSLTIGLRQGGYDFWKVNSTISVHRSNNRYLVTISEDNFDTSDIQDQDISKLENGKFRAHRLVSMKPYRKLHEIYCQISDFQPSFGSFVKLKPFYISPPTNKEMEMCLYSK